MYPNTVPYHKGNSVRKYVNQAGGYGLRSKKSHTYIVYMNGMVAKAGNGVKPEPGCEIVVPSKPKANRNAIARMAVYRNRTCFNCHNDCYDSKSFEINLLYKIE